MTANTAENRRAYPSVPPIRDEKLPPHVPLRALRQATGLTLEQVSERIADAFPEMNVSRGTLSAIESGSRGVSDLMLRALERAYGIDEGVMTTAYLPRARADREVA